jgi:hypothetical protein
MILTVDELTLNMSGSDEGSPHGMTRYCRDLFQSEFVNSHHIQSFISPYGQRVHYEPSSLLLFSLCMHVAELDMSKLSRITAASHNIELIK